MHIAVVSMNANPLGGFDRRSGGELGMVIDGMCRAFAALGHRTSVYVRRDDPFAPQTVSTDTMTLAHVPAGPPVPTPVAELVPWIAGFSAGLAERLADDPPDVVHALDWMSAKAALAATRDGTPVVATFEHLVPRPGVRDSTGEQKKVVRAVDRIVAMSSSQVFALMGLGASPSCVRFVPCGVDLARFAFSPARRPADGRFRIATLGGFGPRGGAADIIDALPLVGGVELVVGGGTMTPPDLVGDADLVRLLALAAERGVADRVTFAGAVAGAEMPAFLRSADVVVCAPHDDAIGAVALAAMACGTPPIASSVGGLLDAVADGMTGVHVAPHAPRQLAYAVGALHADPARRERYGRLGIERATTRFGWSRAASQLLDVYRSVGVRSTHRTRSPA